MNFIVKKFYKAVFKKQLKIYNRSELKQIYDELNFKIEHEQFDETYTKDICYLLRPLIEERYEQLNHNSES